MIHESNPVIAQLKEANKSQAYSNQFYITTSAYGRYAIKDNLGILHGVYSNKAIAETFAKNLNVTL